MIPNALPQSILDNPRLNQWIGFTDDKVIVSTGKVELGQGILTALSQIAAEELEVRPSRILMQSGETSCGPDEGVTAGSLSIEMGGAAIRQVSAEVRQLFIEHIACMAKVSPESLKIEDGEFHCDGGVVGTYWSEASVVDLDCEARGSLNVRQRSNYRIVGHDLPRVDLPAKVLGSASFIHDIRLPDMLHARVLRRPRRGARLANEPLLPGRFAGMVEIVREGDFVALLSDDEFVVQECAPLVADRLIWEDGQPVPDEAGEPEWLRRQASVDTTRDVGTVGNALRTSRFEATYWRPYLAHGSIGPSCALAQVVGARTLTVYTHSQGVFPLRAALAKALALDPADIDVRHKHGAGCYGHNGADDAAFDAAFLAVRTHGRPVRVLWTRRDELSASPVGAAMSIDLAAELDVDGRPSGWTISVWSTPHAQRPGTSGGVNLLGAEAIPNGPPLVTPLDLPDAIGAGAMRNAVALYDFPQKLISHFVPDVPVRTSALRGLGALGNVFAIESFIDELADNAGQDPIAFRLSLLKDRRARRVLEAVAETSQWNTLRTNNAGGVGVAFSRYKNYAAYMATVAEVSVGETVQVHRIWCVVDAGLVVSPDGARNQIEGGIVQATSWALHEEVRFSEGEIAAKSWEQYPILRFSEAPAVDTMIIDAIDEPPLGVGEVALGPTAAAIGNAVAMALGQRVRRLPFNRVRLVEALT
ncbi:molybdopterin cofactor-binding domain-containing protein [Mesorhizobium sp. M8A.F.Ca.ET.165.01.1.1]|uniref:xanthine dehydrogenase family protein molybdopterin-binding subunit n=1 Tax=Mesorhizobium sp. M8A.F.Ca.ET.165.01.1.1 TaxID=2563960 RepID=UPI001093E41A|nr:molybdopterin cofactor-binding domain-containing protein [Mesorhizobium sp. M8A.F.Ca.ET.165.01.1.1]TGT36298.1 xanthine dehydrogenase family protein molybdopterin-binding subunit [Mesorhizobium sp. M8A.F.Ca.ET.165.01.1.1]